MIFRALENVDRRVLGAVRFLDATSQLQVRTGLQVQSETARLRINRSGLFVIWSAQGLEAHETAFDSPPATPPIGSVQVLLTVSDTASRYLARRCTLRLPRSPDVDKIGLNSSLFQPIDVRLFPAPTAPVLSGWALIRATVKKAGSDSVLAGALIRIVKTADQTLLASGLSDSRGEALVVVPGIPATTFGDGGGGAVIGTEIEVAMRTIFDPAATGVPDPDDLEQRSDTLPHSTMSIKLASSRTLITNLTVPLP
jgi:hypothetical protein